MTNQFFIIIEKKDSDNFRKFKIKKFNNDTNKILKAHNSGYVWGFHKGKISNSVWDKIRKNDKIFLTIPKENFKIFGIVSKKIKNSNFGDLIYPGDLSSKQINHFIFFDKLEKSSVSYHELINNSVSKNVLPISGIHEIKKQYYAEKEQKEKPKPFVEPDRKRGPPEKNKSEVYRFLRDTTLVKKLKSLYNNKCQICDYTFEYKKNKFYSEVHHYNPLEENGDDNIGNMIVVCPNHHSEFDHKIIAIGYDGTSIINTDGKKIGEIKFHKNHTLDKKNIDSQIGG